MFDVFIMDMGGHDENLVQLKCRLPHAQSMRYMTSHLEMVKRAAAKSRTEFFWLIASCCDYSNFDFSYVPTTWEYDQMHCWASGDQKFGDTFLINVSAWTKQQTVEKLEWYQHINWHSDGVERLHWKKNVSGNLPRTIKDHSFTSLYEWFLINDDVEIIDANPILWENRSIISYNKGIASLCPRDVKNQIETQLYDYANIQIKNDAKLSVKQDIVFVSYDEVDADKNYQILIDKFPNSKRVHGVKGMITALKQAARVSSTDWFYAVFAKTRIHENFDFSFNPDYLQGPKHYIFYSHNTLNDLVYGEMGIIMYNKELVLSSPDKTDELDFTMSMPHAIVPIVSCYGDMDASELQTWRTAFRECCKLASFIETQKSVDIENEYRLHVWKTYAKGKYAEWALKGAKDGEEYYQKNKGNKEELNKIMDWEWLAQYFNSLHKTH